MRVIRGFAVAIISAMFIGCEKTEVVDAPESVDLGVVHRTINDDGKKVSLKVGQEFSISLPENRTTGYQWQLDSGELLSVKSDVYVTDNDSGLAGAGGMREYLLVVDAVGTEQLKAKYVRPWENDAEPAQTFEIGIEVE